MQLDLGRASIEQRAIVVAFKLGPGRRVRHAEEHARRPPEIVAPAGRAFAALDNDPDRNTGRRRVHVTASRCRTGKPLTRFCGFMRISLSAPMAKMRKAGSPRSRSTATEGSRNVS